MKLTVRGQGDVTLTQQHFKAKGGQASVYLRSSTAYKVYTDPRDMIPVDKFHALAAIKDDHVIKPEQVLLDAKNNPVGYTMSEVKDPFSLMQLFAKSFRIRNKVSGDQIVTIASKLREHVANVHKAQVLVVDLNELNILVPKTFDDVYLIDVDSYQTKGYPATVILPSVRDFSVPSKDFSPLSDWFSYGVLAFQLFIGIHPYRGQHDPSDAVPLEDRLEHRMRHNISAFRKDVGLPGCCYAFDTIPQHFRDWLKAVLEDGKRLAPPDPRGAAPVALLTPQMQPFLNAFLVASGNLAIVELVAFEGWQLISYAESTTDVLVLLSKGDELEFRLNGRLVLATTTSALPGTVVVGFTPSQAVPVAFQLHDLKLSFMDLSRKKTETLDFEVDEIAKSGERFYVRSLSMVTEIMWDERKDKISPFRHEVASVMEKASTLYDGVVLQNMLGSTYANFFPKSQVSPQIRIAELDNYRIQEAKCEGGVLMVLGFLKGKYNRLIFRFDEDYTSYDLRVIADVNPVGLNFVTLASGICVSLSEEEKIEAFSAKKGSSGLKVVEDKALSNDMRLMRAKGKVAFERGGKIYQMSLK